jgi:hypothetical protein
VGDSSRPRRGIGLIAAMIVARGPHRFARSLLILTVQNDKKMTIVSCSRADAWVTGGEL